MVYFSVTLIAAFWGGSYNPLEASLVIIIVLTRIYAYSQGRTSAVVSAAASISTQGVAGITSDSGDYNVESTDMEDTYNVRSEIYTLVCCKINFGRVKLIIYFYHDDLQ